MKCASLRTALLLLVVGVLSGPATSWAQYDVTWAMMGPAPGWQGTPAWLNRQWFGAPQPYFGLAVGGVVVDYQPNYTIAIRSDVQTFGYMRADVYAPLPPPHLPWHDLLMGTLSQQVTSNYAAYVWGEAFHDKGARAYLGVHRQLLDFNHNGRVSDKDFAELMDYLEQQQPNNGALPYLQWYREYKKVQDAPPTDQLPGDQLPDVALPGASLPGDLVPVAALEDLMPVGAPAAVDVGALSAGAAGDGGALAATAQLPMGGTQAAAVPEPATGLVAALGAGVLILLHRRR